MANQTGKEIIKLQTRVWGGLKTKFEKHMEETGLKGAPLLKMILNEYYSKTNTDYNTINKP